MAALALLADAAAFAGPPDRHRDLGLADIHLHITAEQRAGGKVIHGRSFHPDGIAHALGGDAGTHGPEGVLDVTGNLLRDGLPLGTHDTDGWPAFDGWPTHDTLTHQQVYWRWLRRMWRAGLRLVVAQTVEDEPLCNLEPIRSHSCDETRALALQVARLRALERHVDRRSGGRGRGFLRLVYSPRQARRAIERGKLAVVIGAESSNPFGCHAYRGRPLCTREDIDRGIGTLRRLGIRSLFVAHWVDNALAGAALEGGDKGTFINLFNRLHTGSWFRTGECPRAGQGEEPFSVTPGEFHTLAEAFPLLGAIVAEAVPSYPPGHQCNTRGLTALGEYAIRRLMRARILIEVDHLSERARARVLEIAKQRKYPLISSHTDTGGPWTAAELRRLYRLGGIASATPAQAHELPRKVLRFRRHRSRRHYFGVPLGTDTGGFASLPGPRDSARPLGYPFRAFGGGPRFGRQQTGERVFDLNSDGVAHYGLFADLLADVRRQPHGKRALRLLYRSAEAYLRTWERTVRR